MRAYFAERLQHLLERLEQVEQTTVTTFRQCLAALDILEKCDLEFKLKVKEHGFSSDEEEICYFRHQRPLLLAEMLYYSRRYHIEIGKPTGSHAALCGYYRAHLEKIDRFFLENDWFIRYVRSGATSRDMILFTRYNIGPTTVPESSFPVIDRDQTTSYDLKLGKLYAYERLAPVLNGALAGLMPLLRETVEHQATRAGSKPVDLDNLLTSDQVQRKLKKSPSSLQRLRKSGELPFIKSKGVIYYEPAAVREYLERNRHNQFDD